MYGLDMSPVNHRAKGYILNPYPDPQKDLKIRSPRIMGELYKDHIGVIMGLYRGSNF